MDNKEHWEMVYGTKAPNAVSWYAPHLETSLNLIHQATSNKDAAIIGIALTLPKLPYPKITLMCGMTEQFFTS